MVQKVNHELTNLKTIVSVYDNELFLWHDATSNLMSILAMLIHDFVYYRNALFQKNVISEWKEIFKVGTHESEIFKFLVLGVRQTKDGITMVQNEYVSSISPIDIKKRRSLRKYDELSQDKTELKRLTCQMMWVSTQTQPDVAFDVSDE